MALQNIADDKIPATESDNRLLSVNSACQLLAISRTSLYELLASKQLQAIKLGKRRLILVCSVDRMIARKLAEANQ